MAQGKFEKKEARFTKNKRKLHATDYPEEPNNLQRVFDTLNWIFDEASKVEIKRRVGWTDEGSPT